MAGSELLKVYTAKCDHSGSEEDQYAQLLMTIWSNIFDKIYPLLEEAERQGKRLEVIAYPESEVWRYDELVAEDIISV